MNYYRIAKRLQLALNRQGRRVKINHVQYFSKLTGKPATMYIVVESRALPGGRTRNIEICSSSRMPDIVKALAKLLRNGGE